MLLAPMLLSTGARLALPTVMATTSLSAKLPSLAIKVTLYVPDWKKVGVQLKEPAPLAESTKTAPEGGLTADRDKTVPSGSVAETRNCNNWFSGVLLAPIGARMGARLVLLTVIFTISL